MPLHSQGDQRAMIVPWLLRLSAPMPNALSFARWLTDNASPLIASALAPLVDVVAFGCRPKVDDNPLTSSALVLLVECLCTCTTINKRWQFLDCLCCRFLSRMLLNLHDDQYAMTIPWLIRPLLLKLDALVFSRWTMGDDNPLTISVVAL